jgi:ferric-dicitrate binding protein FerR (iron transport regulator)
MFFGFYQLDSNCSLCFPIKNQSMDSQNTKDEKLRRRGKELQEQEHALRLRELEVEINQQTLTTQLPISPTTKHQEPETIIRRRYRQARTVAKFLGIVVAVVVAVRIATWLATAILVGGIAWFAYTIFFESNASDEKQRRKR